MIAWEKNELTVSVCHIERFLKLGIPIYNSKVLNMAGRKNRKKKNSGNCKVLFVSCKHKQSSSELNLDFILGIFFDIRATVVCIIYLMIVKIENSE